MQIVKGENTRFEYLLYTLLAVWVVKVVQENATNFLESRVTFCRTYVSKKHGKHDIAISLQHATYKKQTRNVSRSVFYIRIDIEVKKSMYNNLFCYLLGFVFIFIRQIQWLVYSIYTLN